MQSSGHEGRETGRIDNNPGWVRSVAFAPDGKTLAIGSGNTLRLWDVQGNRLTPDGHGVAAVMMTTVAIWDTSNGALKDYFDRRSGSSSDCLAVSPDGRWLAVTDGQLPHIIDITPPLAP